MIYLECFCIWNSITMVQQYYRREYKGHGYRAQLNTSVFISPKILRKMKTTLWPIKFLVYYNTIVIKKNRIHILSIPLKVPPFQCREGFANSTVFFKAAANERTKAIMTTEFQSSNATPIPQPQTQTCQPVVQFRLSVLARTTSSTTAF